MSKNFQYDLFVIGGGSGGVRCARFAASLGANVGLAEEKQLGGTCVNVGCVPKKLYHYAADYAHDFHDARGFGWQVPVQRPEHRWSILQHNVATEVHRLNGIYERMLLKQKVSIYPHRATLLDAHTLQVGDERITAERILIATGAKPWVPDAAWAKDAEISDAMFDLKQIPKRIAIVGAGYIALEFATIFKSIGSDVDIIYHRNQPLRGFDSGICKAFTHELEQQGIGLHLSTQIEQSQKRPNGRYHLTLSNGQEFEVDRLLAATGRRPNVQGLGLQGLGIHHEENGRIIINDDYATNIPHIFAVGDVSNTIHLTPLALEEGMYVAKTLFGDGAPSVDYAQIPTAVFTLPTIATVGMTEEAAATKFGKEGLEIFESDFRAMRHTIGGRSSRTFMKLIVAKESQKVLGCHMMGEESGEIIQGLAVALKAGATKSDFDRTIGIHPTAAEEFVTMRTARQSG